METYSVLIVEDESTTRQRLAGAIEQHPFFTVSVAVGSCTEARAVFVTRLPRVLLLDIGLPDGDGGRFSEPRSRN